MSARFLQIHFLTAYAASLLNRDDAGFAKRLPFGGSVRTRVSSQCLKRHWRTHEGAGSLDALELPATYRSRHTFRIMIAEPLIAEGLDEARVNAVVSALRDAVLGKSEAKKAEKSEKSEKADKKGKDDLQTDQVTVLGEPEVAYLRTLARTIATDLAEPAKAAEAVKSHLGKEGAKNLLELKNASGLSAAMFGRMITSDLLARGDAAVHVAHAFTVHKDESEPDYFSAVDDLIEGQGSGHINSNELTTGLYYGYVVVDVPLLVRNLGGDASVAGQVVERLIGLIATVSPGAKLGSTAPYAFARALLVEAGDQQPRTLANAFLRAVPARDDVEGAAYAALEKEITGLDTMYGRPEGRKLAAVGLTDEQVARFGAERAGTLADLSAWAAAKVQS